MRQVPTTSSPADLASLYGVPNEASLVKELSFVSPEYRAWIEASPFCVLATAGPEGLDCSPRGDAPGFVRVQDERTLILPDRRGNNRIDSLGNVLHDPRVALLFLIPGQGETLRVNGQAAISVEPDLLGSFAIDGKAPRSALVVAVEAVYFQCSRAVVRADLWNAERHVAKGVLPSPGRILAAASRERIGGESYDRELPDRVQSTLY